MVLFGLVRADGTGIYGENSTDGRFDPRPLGEGMYAFGVRLKQIPLLPGKYVLRGHAMDPEALRLFDTVEAPFVVTGQSRDYGFVRLAHDWEPGRGRRN